MIPMSSRRGAADSMALPLMIVSFIAIGGFLYWLSVTAEPTQVAIVEEDPADMATDGSERVAWDAFGADPQSFQGRMVQIPGVPVASRLGNGAFWSQLPNETPYLVKLDEQLIADSLVVSPGDVGDLTGSVHLMSDSVLAAWDSAGIFTDDVQKIEAEFATSFLEAEAFVLQTPGG